MSFSYCQQWPINFGYNSTCPRNPNPQYEIIDVIENDYYDDFANDIDEILENVTEEEKNEVIDSLWFIFQQEVEKIVKKRPLLSSNNNYFQQISPSNSFIPPNQIPPSNPYQPFLPFSQPPSFNPISSYQTSIPPLNNFFMTQQLFQLNQQKVSKSDKDEKKKDKKQKKDKKKDKKQKNDKKDKKQTKKPKKSKEDSSKPKFTKTYSGSPFDGIFNELSQQCHGNVCTNGIINITGNICDGSSPFESIVDFNYSGECYNSDDTPNSYICFDFKDKKVSVSAYSIKSSTHSTPDYLKSWVIEGSDNNIDWTLLDSHNEETCLCSNAKVATFIIQNESKKKLKFRFIQLRMTGPSDKGNDYLDILNMELFGSYFQTF